MMDSATEDLELIRQQAALEIQIMNAVVRRCLVPYPEELAAYFHTARALRRSPDKLSLRDVTAFGGSR